VRCATWNNQGKIKEKSAWRRKRKNQERNGCSEEKKNLKEKIMLMKSDASEM